MEKYPSIPRIHDKDYHSIKDDTLLVSVYSVGNVIFRGMQILDAFLTAEIRTTNDYKEYEIVFVRVDVPMNQPQLIVSTQGTYRSSPRAHRTPTLTTTSPEGKKRKQLAGETSSPGKPLKEEIEKMVEGDEDEESYASEFADSMINDYVDDSGTRIEPGSRKEHSENVNDDDEAIEKEMKDDEIEKEETNDNIEKMNAVVKEKDNDEGASGTMDFRNEKMQTPIPTPTRSHRKDLSSDKTIYEELTATVSPTTATTSKDSSTSKHKKRPISYKMKILPGSIAGMCRRRGQICSHIKNKFITHEFFMSKIREVLDHCNNVVLEMMFAKTNEIINKEMPRLVNLAVNKDREVDPINAQEMIFKEFATHGPKVIEELF
ncbi:hypothetical protein Tco_1019547 [Tanacetum coccineum]|uniref:Uncharacterized protein n=1 Tax=Tanacetum coccineum TaxID=301880 RepID=A0ABQ5FZD3_9ASTR